MSEIDPIVWGAGTWRTFRVYWALHELGVAFEKRTIRTRTPDMDREEFLAVSPGKKIPAIQHGGVVLTESGAVVSYLYDRFERAASDAVWRAQVARWSLFVLTEIDATALYVLRRHRDLPQIYGEAEAAVTAGIEYYERQISVVDEALADDRPFIAGQRFSPADIHLVSCCDWAYFYELDVPARVAAYHEVQRQRPAYKQALESNRVESS